MIRETLIDFFDDLARARGEFLVHDDGFRSRRSRTPKSRGPREALRRGSPPGSRGDKIVFFSENRPEWIVAFWGCLLSGIVVVPIDYRSSPDFLARVARIVAAKLVLVGQDVPPVRDAVGAPIWRLHEMEWADGRPPAGRHHAGTTSRRSSSRRARQPNRKAWSSRTATCSPTSCRSNARC